jgi:hypothetical protein
MSHALPGCGHGSLFGQNVDGVGGLVWTLDDRTDQPSALLVYDQYLWAARRY